MPSTFLILCLIGWFSKEAIDTGKQNIEFKECGMTLSPDYLNQTNVIGALRQPSTPLKNKLYRIAKMKKKTVDPKLAALAQRYLDDIRSNADRRVDGGGTWRFFNP